jgi:translation initiation factor 2 beta subunit (eIF-2beta)/eIF-5
MDRETVITHLQIIHTWAEFARERDLQFFTAKHLEDIAQWSDDAIAMLTKQHISDAIHETAKQFRRQIVMCKDCKKRETMYCPFYWRYKGTKYDDWFCADGEGNK